jgi:hypothetical protein
VGLALRVLGLELVVVDALDLELDAELVQVVVGLGAARPEIDCYPGCSWEGCDWEWAAFCAALRAAKLAPGPLCVPGACLGAAPYGPKALLRALEVTA